MRTAELARLEELLCSPGFDEREAALALARFDRTLLDELWRGVLGRAAAAGRSLIAEVQPHIFYRDRLLARLSRRGPVSEAQLQTLYASAWSAHMVLFVTRACQLRCRYCSLAKGGAPMPPEVVDAAVRLLAGSLQRHVQLQFFGGEPLLAFGAVRRAVLAAERAAARSGKTVSFFMSTNALALGEDKLAFLREHRVRLEASCDGPKEAQLSQRAAPGGRDYYAKLMRRLERLRDSGADYHVTAVIPPEAAARAGERFRYLAGLGHRRVQLNYALGRFWTAAQADALSRELAAAAAAAPSLGAELLNFQPRRREPVALNSELIVGYDGRLYHKSGVYFEEGFETLSPRFLIGPLREAAFFDRYGATRFDELALLVGAYLGEEARLRVMLNNIALGARLGRLPARAQAAA